MRKIWTFIKKVLKRFFPVTVHILMREVNGLHGAMAAREANLSHQLGVAKAESQSLVKQIGQQQAERLDRMEKEQGKRLERLGDLFESANRENLRLFFEGREERREMDQRYAQLAGQYEALTKEVAGLRERQAELEKQLAENRSATEKILAENQSAVIDGQKKLEMGVTAVQKAAEEGARSASESVWAEIFNQTISDSAWLKDKSFSPGRWAVGYPYLYVMYRVLNETKPRKILELGLGQSTRMIAQYAAAHEGVEHFVVEHDPAWIEFFVNDFTLPTATKIVQLPWDYVTYKEADSVRVYKEFQKTFAGQTFDFISIDGPLGGDMKQYSRIDVLGLIPDCLEPSFAVLVDDCERPGERNTVREIEAKLAANDISCTEGFYSGNKDLFLLVSPDKAFLTTM